MSEVITNEPFAAAPAMPDFNELLGNFTRQNPNLAWMAQMLAAQRQAREASHDDVIDTRQAQIDALHDELAAAQTHAQKCERTTRRVVDELRAAHERLADLAAAFGACGLCWGQDERCPGCRGRGKPGRFAPDPDLRSRFFSEPLPAAAASRT